jgi:hypothetical protein
VRSALCLVCLGMLLLSVSVEAPRAHIGGTTGYASITVSRSTVRYTLTLPTAALPSDLMETLRLAQTGSQQNRDKLLDVLRRHIVLRANGTRCEPGPGEVMTTAFDATSFTMHLDFACGSAVRDLVVEDNIFDVLGVDHHTLAKVETDGETRELAFAPDSRVARVQIGARGAAGAGTSFFKLGIEHILTGYDHLLFLLVLLLSIIWVALENLLRKDTPSQRWLISFFFGLVHGFGFASAIEPLALPPGRLALALLGFNLGVEAGQAFVVALLLPLLLWMRGTAWEPRVVRAASLGVVVMGLAWLVERVFFVS